MKAYVTALGCRLNQAEMADLARALADIGYEAAESAADADVVIVNTCAVTQEAERKSRQLLRRLRRGNASAYIVATGCLAELQSTAGAAPTPADRTVGNVGKQSLIARPEDYVPRPDSPRALPPSGRTRALVRIQEGCDNRCAYCVVNRLRGPQRSADPGDVVAEVRRLEAAGYQEVVLTGVHTGAYGSDRGDVDLSGLLRRLLASTHVPRIRLSSVEPWDVMAIDLGLWRDVRLCRHFHLPLQSGSDAVLARMGRRYTTSEYAGLLSRLRERIPDLAVTTDVIVGLPGETEAEFAESLAFVSECGFARLHVFPYSSRPGTAAASMPGQVGAGLTTSRASVMRDFGARARTAYEDAFVGRTVRVLWERRCTDVWQGLTSNYLRVQAREQRDLQNSITDLKICGREADRLVGVVPVA